MDAQKLTEKSQNALAEAQKIAANRGHQGVDAEHLLQALLEGAAIEVVSMVLICNKHAS